MSLRPPNNQCLVFAGTPNGGRYRMFSSNSGDQLHLQSWTTVPIQADEITPVETVTLRTEDLSECYRLRVDDTDVNNPKLMLHPMDVSFGKAQAYLFSPNQREWEVIVTPGGVPRLRSLGSDWPRITVTPTILAPNLTPWQFSSDDAGLYSVTPQPGLDVQSAMTINLRSTDDTKAFAITIDNTGLISVSDPLANVDQATYYDVQLISPGGFYYLLQVTAAGLIQVVTDLQDAMNGRDEWVTFLTRNNNMVYVVDERFRPPMHRLSSSYGSRVRRYY